MTPVSNEDYDYTLRTQPYLCRPLSGDMGDYRSAKHTLVGYCCSPLECEQSPEGGCV